MSLMPKLFKYLSDDILSENILEIMRQYESINFKQFNNIVAKKCAIMLKEYLLKRHHLASLHKLNLDLF